MPFRASTLVFLGVLIFLIFSPKNAGYILEPDGKSPKMPPGMKDHLYDDFNKSFEF